MDQLSPRDRFDESKHLEDDSDYDTEVASSKSLAVPKSQPLLKPKKKKKQKQKQKQNASPVMVRYQYQTNVGPPVVITSQNIGRTQMLMEKHGHKYKYKMEFLGQSEPIFVICKFCNKKVKTRVTSNVESRILCEMCSMCIILPLFWVPLCWTSHYEHYHFCQQCGEQLGRSQTGA